MSPPTPRPLPDRDVERVLVVSAHPDDVDFGVAGTVAGWTDAGIEVTYCVVTDGQAGGFDPAVSRADLAGIRRAEQTTAAEIVGVSDVRFLGYVDGELTVSRELVEQLTRVIREVRPQRAVVQSPDRDYSRIFRSHPDHLAAGEAALQAIYPAARNPFAFPDLLAAGLEPWAVPDTWISGHPDTNHVMDVTAGFDRKMRAILAHVSQHADPVSLESRVRTSFGAWAVEAGLAEGSFAEAYLVVPTA